MLHQEICEITVFNIPYSSSAFKPLQGDFMLCYFYVKFAIREIN